MNDTSSVFHVDMLDDEHRDYFDTPWLFEETDGTLHPCRTENEACDMQYQYRERNGYDPITGEEA